MLQKPGSGGSKARAAARTTTSRQKNKSPDDIVRELQRMPTNKKCADCFAKLPQAANLTFGTFVCLVCAGIHREFSHRIKGIGHSSFTVEEANTLKEIGGNEVINAKYLATYKESYENLKQPSPSDEGDDQMKLRYWIRKKYVELAWVVKEDSVKKTKTKKKKKDVVKEEPAKEVDLFSDDALFGAPAPVAAQSSFAADFGDMSVSTPAPAPPPATSFHADFGNFSSTPISAPPTSAPPPPSTDPFANPPTSAPPAPSSDLFAAPPASAPPPPQPSDPFAATAPSTSFNADFGNFSSAPPQPQPQQDAFADFNSHQTQPQQPPEPEAKTGMLSSNTNSKFDAFDELSVPEPPQPQPSNNNNNNNNNQDITKSPQHQYMYQMISNLNIDQLVILQQVIDFRMNQMNSQGQMMNQQVVNQPKKQEDSRFASLVNFSAPVAPPPSSAPPPPMGAPPVPTSPTFAPPPMGAPPPPSANFLF